MTDRIYTYNIPSDFAGHKISEYLKSKHYSEKILAALRQDEEALRVDGKIAHMNHIITKSCTLTLCSRDESDLLRDCSAPKVLPVKLPLEILYEDADLMVINKPAHMPIHPSRQNYENTLGNAVIYHYQQKGENHLFRCINRLDKDTSGLTIIAKNRIIAAMLYDQMQNRAIYREYTALVEGTLEGSGTLSMPIRKSDETGTIMRIIDFEKGQHAVTHYEAEPLTNELSLVRLHLDTGRTHQIRVHMKAIGHPLIGDRLYNPDNTLMNRQALHAGILCFTHPYTEEMLTFTAPLPEDMILYNL